MRRQPFVMGIALIVVLLTAGCLAGGSPTPTPTETPTPTPTATPSKPGIATAAAEEVPEIGSLNPVTIDLEISRFSLLSDPKVRITINSGAGNNSKTVPLNGSAQEVSITPPEGTERATTVTWTVKLLDDETVIDEASGQIEGYENMP